MSAKADDGICMRLVEYSRNRRVFRRWTYERCGDKAISRNSSGCNAQLLLDEGLSAKDDDYSIGIHSRRAKSSASSPLARRLKQERILLKERKIMEEEAEDRKRKSADAKNANEEDKEKKKEKQSQDGSVEMRSTENKKRSKEKHDLQIDERLALKEMSELYRDLLERFEELKQQQDAQIAAESDSTRLRREAGNDPSVNKMLHELIDNIKQAASNFKTCAMLAGSSMPNAEHHERELDHIALELGCIAVIK